MLPPTGPGDRKPWGIGKRWTGMLTAVSFGGLHGYRAKGG
jgi:hypothetical protein